MSRLFLVFAIVSLCAATVAVAQQMWGGASLQTEWVLVWGWVKVAPAQSRWPVRIKWQKLVLDSWACPACSA